MFFFFYILMEFLIKCSFVTRKIPYSLRFIINKWASFHVCLKLVASFFLSVLQNLLQDDDFSWRVDTLSRIKEARFATSTGYSIYGTERLTLPTFQIFENFRMFDFNSILCYPEVEFENPDHLAVNLSDSHIFEYRSLNKDLFTLREIKAYENMSRTSNLCKQTVQVYTCCIHTLLLWVLIWSCRITRW